MNPLKIVSGENYINPVLLRNTARHLYPRSWAKLDEPDACEDDLEPHLSWTLERAEQFLKKPHVQRFDVDPDDYWLIVYCQRAPLRKGCDQSDWRSWRKWSVYPIRFPTKAVCEAFMDSQDEFQVFKNISGRKLSRSAVNSKTFKKNLRPKKRF